MDISALLFSFKHNNYIFIDVIPSIFIIYLLITIRKRPHLDKASEWFCLILIAVLACASLDILMYSSATPLAATFWTMPMYSLVTFFPSLIFVWTMYTTDREYVVDSFWKKIYIFLPSIFWTGVIWFTNLVADKTPDSLQYYFNSWRTGRGELWGIFNAWTYINIIIVLIILITYYFKSTGPNRISQRTIVKRNGRRIIRSTYSTPIINRN